MLIAIYARVSTDRQEKQETIQSQLSALRDWAKKEGHIIVEEYIDDGWSGAILERPDLDRLRDDANKKKWDSLTIYDRDRIARKLSYQELIIDELTEKNIDVIILQDPLAHDAEGRVLQQVKGIFSEYERVKITERMRRGKMHKARNGNVVTSKAPYGYTYVPKQGNKQGYYKINKQEAEVVKMIFQWVGDEGLSMRKVIKRLKDMDILPRKSKRGVWNTSTLTSLLRNETYIGNAHYNKSYGVVPENPIKDRRYKKIKKTSRKFRPKEDWIDIPVPGIIKTKLFERTRKRLKVNNSLSSRNKKHNYLLSGKIYCVCGKKRAGEAPQKGKHKYYRCTDRIYKHPLPRTCFERSVNARVVDTLVWRGLYKYMTTADILKKEGKHWLSKKKTNITSSGGSIESLRKELENIEREEKRYVKAFGQGAINMKQLGDATSEMSMRKTGIEKQIVKLRRNTDIYKIPTDNEIDTYCKTARKVLKDLGFKVQRKIVVELVTKVIATQKEMIVSGVIPVNEVKYVDEWSISRYCWTTKCGEVYAI